MRLELTIHGDVPHDGLRRRGERAMQFALGRFGARVESVRLDFSEAAGAVRGDQTRCRVRICLRPAGEVTLDALHLDPFLALDHAARRAATSVARRLESSIPAASPEL